MFCFFAASSGTSYSGSLQECLFWGKAKIEAKSAKVIKIFKARPGEPKAIIVFELTSEGIFPVISRRWIELKRLKRAENE